MIIIDFTFKLITNNLLKLPKTYDGIALKALPSGHPVTIDTLICS